MGKCKLPPANQLIEKKIMYEPKREPVWVYIEKEMRINISRKPYNEKVGKWLKFLRDLKYHYYCESKRQLRILLREVGPPWYIEFATFQKEILGYLSTNIKNDLLEGFPFRTRKTLSDLGVTPHIPNKVILNAMSNCNDDPGIFFWNLYSAIYKQSPSELRGEYDMTAMILMSALVAVDLKECIECLQKLTGVPKKPIAIRETKKTRYFEPAVKYGVYLQKMYVPLYCNYPPPGPPKPRPPPPLECKIRIRTEEVYEKLCMDTKFLELRMERSRKQLIPDRICTYKFWRAPLSFRDPDPTRDALNIKKRMLRLKPRAGHLNCYENKSCCVGPVTYVGKRPRYLLNNFCYLPTGYMPINGGSVFLNTGEVCMVVAGYWIIEKQSNSRCQLCNCDEKWESAIMNYVRDRKCMCKHLFDFHWSGKGPETYFYPATRRRQYYLDKAKIYQQDPTEDFIKQTVEVAINSGETTPTTTLPSVKVAGLTEGELLAVLLADLSNTPLIIPHLPQANKLNNLLEWTRRRVKGKIEPELHKQMLVRSMRRWLWLKHMDFRMRAYRIPFTKRQRERMTWKHRPLRLEKVFKLLLDSFVYRNRLRLLEETRLWWSTMKYDMYPVPNSFREIYFTYMPGKMTDTHLYNPYCSEKTPKYGAKTCRLNIFLPSKS